MAFAQIYECSQCGDVWRDVQVLEESDDDRGEVYQTMLCACGREVREKRIDGKPVMHPLSPEEIEAEQGLGFGFDEDGDESSEV